MKRGLRLLVVLLLFSCFGGCIQFEEQTMSYHYDKATDTLRIFQNYRGIFGGEAKGKKVVPLTKTEMSQLNSVMKGQRTFFFTNWIFEYNRKAVEEAIAELSDPAKPKEMKAKDIPKALKLLGFALANVRIENGPFYLEGDKLCGVQSVTITKCSDLIAGLNEFGPSVLTQSAAEESTEPAERKAIAKFLESADRTLVRLDGNALTLRWPTSRASYEKQFGAESDNLEDLKKARDAGLAFKFADDVVTMSLGKPEDEITRLTLPFNSDAHYTCNAVEPVRELYGIKDAFDAAAAEVKFLVRPKEGKK